MIVTKSRQDLIISDNSFFYAESPFIISFEAILGHMNALSFLAAVFAASVRIVDGAIDYDVTTLPL